MADYKAMYLELSRKTEQAIRLLIEAQQRCEEIYIAENENNVVEFNVDKRKGTDEE